MVLPSLDPHWGSQFVINAVDKTGEWEMIRPDSPSGGGDKKDADKEEQIGYNCDDFYFLTDPVALVYTHLTLEPRHQVIYVVYSTHGHRMPEICYYNQRFLYRY